MKIPAKVPEVGFYYHYKHDPMGAINNYAYEVVGTGCHTEDDCREGDKNMVVYRPLYKEAFVYGAGRLFDLRPLDMWLSDVEINGNTVPRFAKITDSKIISKLESIKSEMYD